jgi:hypothetical protein
MRRHAKAVGNLFAGGAGESPGRIANRILNITDDIVSV